MRVLDAELRPGLEPIEIRACSWFRERGEDAYFTENHFWCSTGAILLYPAIFGVNHDHYSDIPRDLFSPGFYAARTEGFQRAFAELRARDESLGRVFADAYASVADTRCRIWCNDDPSFDPDRYAELLDRVPGGLALWVWSRIFLNYSENRSGMPDLLVLSNGGASLVEVKGARDRMRAVQSAWLSYLEAFSPGACGVLVDGWSEQRVRNLHMQLDGWVDRAANRRNLDEGLRAACAHGLSEYVNVRLPVARGHAGAAENCRNLHSEHVAGYRPKQSPDTQTSEREMAQPGVSSELVDYHVSELRTRLLDLTSRNRLLNFRHSDRSRTHVRVIDELPEFLYEHLTSGSVMEFRPVSEPRLEPGADPLSVREAAELAGLNPSFELPEPRAGNQAKAHTDRFVQTLHFKRDLERKLDGVRVAYNTALQELGVPTLYAAFGFLEWCEPAPSDRMMLAPLVLLPLNLTRTLERGGYRFRLEAATDEPESNITLQERLRNDFGIDLPDFSVDGTLADYFGEVRRCVEQQANWRVRRLVTVGIFQFARLVMFKDLEAVRWGGASPDRHSVLPRLLVGGEATGDATIEVPDLDSPSICDRLPILVTDADSSQTAAIIDALAGRSMVIQGPPGTGKSQTITNLIGAALGTGKRVLFIAEKAAALEVVKKRLTAASLRPFCFDLHDPRKRKSETIAALQQRLDLRPELYAKETHGDHLKELRRERNELAEYGRTLKAPAGNSGWTIREFLWRAPRASDEVRSLPPDLRTVELGREARWTTDVIERVRLVLRDLESHAAAACGDPASLEDHAWSFVRRAGIAPPEIPGIVVAVREWHETLKRLDETLAAGSVERGFATDTAISRWVAILANLPDASSIDEEVFCRLRGDAIAADIASVFESLDAEARITRELAGICSAPQLVSKLVRPLNETAAAIAASGLADTPVADLPGCISDARQQATRWQEAALRTQLALRSVGIDGLRLDSIGVGLALGVLDQLRSADRSALLARSPITTSEANAVALAQAHARASELRTQRDWFAQYYRGWEQHDPSSLRNHAQVLRSASWLGRIFSSGYRSARLTYAALTGGRSGTPQDMAQQLDALAAFMEARTLFESDPQVSTLGGSNHGGIDTDFETLSRTATWAASARARFASFEAAPQAACRFLLEGPVDSLDAFVHTVEAGAEQVLREWVLSGRQDDIQQAAAKQKASADRLAARLEQLDPLGIHRQQTGMAFHALVDAANQLCEVSQRLDACRVAAAMVPTDPVARDRVRAAATAAASVRAAAMPDSVLEWTFAKGDGLGFRRLRKWLADLAVAQQDTSRKRQRCEAVGVGANRVSPPDAAVREALERLSRSLADESALKAWIGVLNARERAMSTPGAPVVTAWEGCRVSPTALTKVFEDALCRLVGRQVAVEHPKLAAWSGVRLEATRARFQTLDRQILELNQKLLTSELGKVRPPHGVSSGPKREWTDASLIRHEASKKRRHLPIRELIARASDAILAIKPCFMMSPLSVAQYLPPGPPLFDIVVIDEASQMRPEDACGAVLRGGQIVVVGDDKQLPPTNFFERFENHDDNDAEEEVDEATEAESILDLANGAFAPSRLLRWHYRSRHESLIAFSNEHFYDGSLLLFPSASHASNLGVRFAKVEGNYKSGVNPAEAEAVASAAVAAMQEDPDRSLGVVTMNHKQAEFIEELVDAKLADLGDDSYVRRWKDTLEPFFVKNLERVQGDERDVMFISFTYGPEHPGAPVAQRFGPINMKGGHRRLNVLFTRAKQQVVAFSSMTASDVVVAPESKPGVVALKAYLAYAASGGTRGSTPLRAGRAAFDSPFEEEIARLLTNHGFTVTPQVGVKGFFIDLGVGHPAYPHGYVCGVECDGATYHSSRSARERDRLRQEILEGLGWNLVRVWSTDWYEDREATGRKLITKLQRLVREAAASTGTLPANLGREGETSQQEST